MYSTKFGVLIDKTQDSGLTEHDDKIAHGKMANNTTYHSKWKKLA